jgi:hypothetical protein
LGKGATARELLLPPALEARCRLADERRCRRILVATVSRLLEFSRIYRCLDWTCREAPEGLRIDIAGLVHPIFGREKPGPDQFQGLSFHVPRGVPTTCRACRLGENPEP